MNDDTTERVKGRFDAYISSVDVPRLKKRLTTIGAGIGIWALLGFTVSWTGPHFLYNLTPVIAIRAALSAIAISIATERIIHYLPLISDWSGIAWTFLRYYGWMVIVAAVFAVIAFWGPPTLVELLRGPAVIT